MAQQIRRDLRTVARKRITRAEAQLQDYSTRWGDNHPQPTREAVEEAMVAYMDRQTAAHGTPWAHMARHMLGLRNGTPGARRWRQVWSDHRLKGLPATEVMARARQVLT